MSYNRPWCILMLGLVLVCFSGVLLAQEMPGDLAPSGTSTPTDGEASYRIGPGDTLDVFVWRNPEISTKVTVRPDGMISTPLVEDMVAVGKTPTQLARDMEQVLAWILLFVILMLIIEYGVIARFERQAFAWRRSYSLAG